MSIADNVVTVGGTVAAVVVNEGFTVDVDEIRAKIKESLAAYKVPRKVFVLPELPKNNMGKVLRFLERILAFFANDAFTMNFAQVRIYQYKDQDCRCGYKGNPFRDADSKNA